MKTRELLWLCTIVGGSVWNASALARAFELDCYLDHSVYLNYDTKVHCDVNWNPPLVSGIWDISRSDGMQKPRIPN